MSSQFNTLVQGLNIASITPQQILAAGDPIFLDIKTIGDINSINTLIQSYARIHAPTYGTPIPSSGGTATLDGDGELLSPGIQEVALISALQVENTDAFDSRTVSILIGGVLVSTVAIDPSTTTAVSLTSRYINKATPLSIYVGEGSAAEVTSTVAYTLTSQ